MLAFMKLNLWRILAALALAALAASLVWSVLFETLLPLVQAGDWDALGRNLVGIPLIFAGVGAFAWGGWLLLRGLFDPDLGWRRGASTMAAGVLLIALGSFLIN